jgi:DNA-binding NarL/FixJ family response regulator
VRRCSLRRVSAALSPTKRRVYELLQAGRSAPDIATELHLSTRTAKAYVAHVRRWAALATGTDRLRPREGEVHVLLAEGLTNRDIAQRLAISTRTVESHVQAVLRHFGVRSRRELFDRDRLFTPREMEVAGLVLRGESNQEIAARLGISERTAEDHVAAILAKTGLPSRRHFAVTAALIRDATQLAEGQFTLQ